MPVSVSGDALIGSVLDSGHYRLLIARIEGEHITEHRLIAGGGDWEGHAICRFGDGYIAGGAVEGIAGSDGGHGWKAYLARLDASFSMIWERKFSLGNSSVIYSIISDDTLLLGGETGDKEKGFFVASVSPEGELLWLREIGAWRDVVFTSLINEQDGFSLIGSVNDGGWKVKRFKFGSDGEMMGDDELACGVAFSAQLWKERLVLAGFRGGRFWFRVGGAEHLVFRGTATALSARDGMLLVGGERDGNAILVEHGDADLSVKELWSHGWVEAFGNDVVLGVKKEYDGVKLVILPFSEVF